ncbi:MAG: hydrogenase maturation protease [Chloroflexi bacterium]|nr:hydrogenase maturation protease [Chloroflexota bacterium]
MTDVLVIGYGNPLRRDDGVGPVVAGRLLKAGPPASVAVLICHQLTLEMAEPLSQAAHVILIDAARNGVPGQIACREIQPDTGLPPTLLHHMTPGALLAGTQALYGRAPHTLLYTITGASFAYGEGLTTVVEAAALELCTRLEYLLQRMAGESILHLPPEFGCA